MVKKVNLLYYIGKTKKVCISVFPLIVTGLPFTYCSLSLSPRLYSPGRKVSEYDDGSSQEPEWVKGAEEEEWLLNSCYRDATAAGCWLQLAGLICTLGGN